MMPGKPRSQGVTGYWKRQGRRPAEWPWEEHGSANAFILGSYTLGDSIPAVSNPLGLWYLAVAATEDERNQEMRACCMPGTLPDVFTSVFPCQPKSSQTGQSLSPFCRVIPPGSDRSKSQPRSAWIHIWPPDCLPATVQHGPQSPEILP